MAGNQDPELVKSHVDYKLLVYNINPYISRAPSIISDAYLSKVVSLTLYGQRGGPAATGRRLADGDTPPEPVELPVRTRT